MVGIGGAGYDFGDGDLRKLLIFSGRVEKFFSWWGTDRKDCVREILLFLQSLEDDDGLGRWVDLFRNKENPKDFGLLLSSFLGGGGGLLSSAKVVTFE